jgi:hypothetical protein
VNPARGFKRARLSGATSMRPRISIAMLLGAMVPIALGLTALANPTAFWEGTTFAIGILLMFMAIIGVCYRRGVNRAFWVGFSLFGWGLFLLSSDVSFSTRSGGSVQFSYNTASAQDDMPVTALIRNLVDTLQLNRSTVPKSVGEKIQVQWGAGSYYYPCTISDFKDNQYKIRYDSDPGGTYDEWVGLSRIKSDGLVRCYRIAQMLFMLLFAVAGGVIGVYFFVSRGPGEPAADLNRSSAA